MMKNACPYFFSVGCKEKIHTKVFYFILISNCSERDHCVLQKEDTCSSSLDFGKRAPKVLPKNLDIPFFEFFLNQRKMTLIVIKQLPRCSSIKIKCFYTFPYRWGPTEGLCAPPPHHSLEPIFLGPLEVVI